MTKHISTWTLHYTPGNIKTSNVTNLRRAFDRTTIVYDGPQTETSKITG